jgi:hypothetical protein
VRPGRGSRGSGREGADGTRAGRACACTWGSSA